MDAALRRLAVELLDANRILTIATNRPDGWPQATVIGYVNDGFICYSFIAREGQKYANVTRDPRVSLAVATDVPHPLQIKGLSVAARASFVSDPAEFRRVMELFGRRYPEYLSMPLPDLTDVPLLRLTPEVISVLDYTKGFGHSDLVTLTADDLKAAA